MTSRRAKHSEPKPSGEASGITPSPASQDIKSKPSIANRGAHLLSYTMVPEPVQSEAKDLPPEWLGRYLERI
jgi:hypothetical protein